jgi:hypothetical protein
VVLVAHTTRSRGAGLVAGAVFALDPFVVRQTSRNLLESPALRWVVLSVTAAAFLVEPGHRRSRRRLLEGVVGVAAGLALLTKEPTAFVVVLPLLVAAVTGWSVPRASALRATGLAAAVYLVYPVVTVLSGRREAFVEEKLSGVLRLVGLQQDTGFNAGRGPSLGDAVLANLPGFGPTYALLLLSAPAVVLLLLRGSPRVPAIAATTAAAVLLRRAGGRAARRTGVAVALVAVLFLVIAVAAGSQARLERNDGYAQALDALRATAPCGARVWATAEPLPFLLDGYRVVEPGRLPQTGPAPADYVLTSSKQVADGFGEADAGTVSLLEEQAEEVFRSPSSDGAGEVVLWRLPGAQGGVCPDSPASGAAQGAAAVTPSPDRVATGRPPLPV